jgi:hypothetical protein
MILDCFISHNIENFPFLLFRELLVQGVSCIADEI